jgi:hypothetical protein
MYWIRVHRAVYLLLGIVQGMHEDAAAGKWIFLLVERKSSVKILVETGRQAQTPRGLTIL